MKNLTEEEAARFYGKTQLNGDCLLWTGPLDRDGYGSFYFRRMNRRAHRVAWFGSYGDLEVGQVINHTCRNRNCVNPQHLQAISASENAKKDSCSAAYINSQKTVCKKGHPFDKTASNRGKIYRFCSICEREKQQRLRKKWAKENVLNI